MHHPGLRSRRSASVAARHAEGDSGGSRLRRRARSRIADRARRDRRPRRAYRTAIPGSTRDVGDAIAPSGEIHLLFNAGEADARIQSLSHPAESLDVAHATDLEFVEGDILVVARLPGQAFLRFRVSTGSQEELPYLNARGYDGRGIARTPDGRVVFWNGGSYAHATLARPRYIPRGRVTSFRFDSGRFQTVWGRVFIDACISRGTEVRAFCLTLDELPEDATLLPRTPPANTVTMTVHRPDLSPPMPPEAMVRYAEAEQRLHRRETGIEQPWVCRADDDVFRTYEAPVIAEAGRYLWVVLELIGGTRSTPRIKNIRVEYPSHDLMRRLPKLYSRDLVAADFLRRYLSILEGNFNEIDVRAGTRHALLDPRAAPKELLPWLGGFVGLLTDERWSERAKRELIEHAIWLFRYRGTVMGVRRFLEIYLDQRVVMLEHFKVRGLGGAFVGEEDALASSSVVGAGFRVGGRVGEEERVSINEQSIENAFQTHAHRFSVIIAASLTREQQEVIAHILEVHRPVHTICELCTVDAGMRVGIGLYTEVTSVVGRGAGFGELQIGGSLLGRGNVLGRPGPGTRVGGSRLGGDARVG
jgi:phage tail-like protein